jgi:hypothetical protein
VVVGAAEVLRERPHRPLVDQFDVDPSLRQAQAGLDGVREPLPDPLAHDDAVDDDGDRVLVLLPQLRRIVQADLLAVDDGAGVALRQQLREQVLELALPIADQGRGDDELRALRQLEEPVDDLLRRLLLDLLPARGAVRDPDPGPEEAQEVVDLRDRAHGGAGVLRRRLLIDRHRGRQALDEVDVRLVHLPQELPGVGRQGLHVAALALREDRVERQRRLARAAQTGEHDHRVARDRDGGALEIVGAGALHPDNGGVVVRAAVRCGARDLVRGALHFHSPTVSTGTDALTPL